MISDIRFLVPMLASRVVEIFNRRLKKSTTKVIIGHFDELL